MEPSGNASLAAVSNRSGVVGVIMPTSERIGLSGSKDASSVEAFILCKR
jgi:hypothetical protein